jgi:UDP-glucose 4-epimerase
MVLADHFKVKTKETIAVTGATGFIGRHICEGLEYAGYSVQRLSRSGGPEANHIATGDLGGSPRWSDFLSEVDTVVHCAALSAVPDKMDGNLFQVLDRVNTQAVGVLAEACAASRVRRLIFLSSAKVYGESTSRQKAFRETDDLSPQDEYGRSKSRAEQLLKKTPG